MRLENKELTLIHQEGHRKGMREGFDRGAASVLYALLGTEGEVTEVAKDWIEGAKWKKLRIDTVAEKLQKTYERETYQCNACGKQQPSNSPLALRWNGRQTEIVCKACFDNPPPLKVHGKSEDGISSPSRYLVTREERSSRRKKDNSLPKETL